MIYRFSGANGELSFVNTYRSMPFLGEVGDRKEVVATQRVA